MFCTNNSCACTARSTARPADSLSAIAGLSLFELNEKLSYQKTCLSIMCVFNILCIVLRICNRVVTMSRDGEYTVTVLYNDFVIALYNLLHFRA